MLKFAVAQSALYALKKALGTEHFKYADGFSPAEYNSFIANEFWHRGDRPEMSMVYQQILFKGQEFSGAEHFDAPAEWQAAVIATFVSPVNWMSACSWFATHVQPAMSIAGLDTDTIVGATEERADVLFAFVLLIHAEPKCKILRTAFDKAIAFNLDAQKVKSNA